MVTKIVPMPKCTEPDDGDSITRSIILPDEDEESASLARIRRWLEIGDAALADSIPAIVERSA